MESSSRRSFNKKTAAGSVFMATAGILLQFSAKSYARIIGVDDHINVSIMWDNSWGILPSV